MTLGWDHPRRKSDLPQPTPLGVWLAMLAGSLVIATVLWLVAHANETAEWWGA